MVGFPVTARVAAYKGGAPNRHGGRHISGVPWSGVARPPAFRHRRGRTTVRPAGTVRPPGRPAAAPSPIRDRFLSVDGYRANREWQRYLGTAQRDLFRELRERFLARHSPSALRALDVGSGPGRFTARLGAIPASQRVAFDIGREMLQQLPEHW